MDLQLLRELYMDIARDISVGLTGPQTLQGLAYPSFFPYEVSHISSLRILAIKKISRDTQRAPSGAMAYY